MSGYFPEYAARATRRVVGLMSGTSADGIDAAVCEISGSGRQTRVRLLHAHTAPYPEALRTEVLAVSLPPGGTVDRLCRVNYAVGEVFAGAALHAIHAAGLQPADLQLIASHGQTVHHLPDAAPLAALPTRSTLQLGEPAVIAQRTGILTVANFRAADIAAGGQGAPLVPYADWVLFGDGACDRAVQNIGGIGNVTFLPAGGGLDAVIAFDTGPGNMLIDAAVAHLTGGRQQCDTGGEWATTGQPDARLLAWLLQHPFLAQPPPRSTGREAFGATFFARALEEAGRLALTEADLLATLTAFTVETIAGAYRRWLPRVPREVILGGGGVHNHTLRALLADALPEVRWRTHAEFGIPDDAKEAVAFAILGNETLLGVPANVPGATGARPAVLGQVAFP